MKNKTNNDYRCTHRVLKSLVCAKCEDIEPLSKLKVYKEYIKNVSSAINRYNNVEKAMRAGTFKPNGLEGIISPLSKDEK